MKIWLLAILAALLGLAIGVGSTLAEFWNTRDEFHIRSLERTEGEGYAAKVSGAGRAVVVNGDRYNFGVIDRNTKHSHVFQIKNEGRGPLKVKVGHTTCKCTVAALKNDSIAPGETADVNMEWEAKGYQDPFTQTAEITTSDIDNPVIRLTITGRVTQAVRPEPHEVLLASVSSSEDLKRTIRLYGYVPDKKLEVLSHAFENPDKIEHYELAIAPLSPDQLPTNRDITSGAELTLTVKSGLPTGPIYQTLRLTTNLSPDAVEIPINGSVASDFSLVHISGAKGFHADKNLITLGKLKPGQGAKVQLFLLVKGAHRAETQVSLGTVEPQNTLQVKLGEPAKLNDTVVKYPVEVVVPATAPGISRLGGEQGEFGTITFNTTDPVAKEVRLYVQFAIEE